MMNQALKSSSKPVTVRNFRNFCAENVYCNERDLDSFELEFLHVCSEIQSKYAALKLKDIEEYNIEEEYKRYVGEIQNFFKLCRLKNNPTVFVNNLKNFLINIKPEPIEKLHELFVMHGMHSLKSEFERMYLEIHFSQYPNVRQIYIGNILGLAKACGIKEDLTQAVTDIVSTIEPAITRTRTPSNAPLVCETLGKKEARNR